MTEPTPINCTLATIRGECLTVLHNRLVELEKVLNEPRLNNPGWPKLKAANEAFNDCVQELFRINAIISEAEARRGKS
jgi:hypothetical protein